MSLTVTKNNAGGDVVTQRTLPTGIQKVEATLKGSILAQDPSADDAPLSVIPDGEGRYILRVARAAKWEPEEQTLFARAVRANSQYAVDFDVPPGVVKAVFHHRVYGVSGTIGESEGIQVQIDQHSGLASFAHPDTFVARVQTDIKAVARSDVLYFADGVTALSEDAAVQEDRSFKVAGWVPFWKMRAYIRITGTYGSGEGFDSELKVVWYYE